MADQQPSGPPKSALPLSDAMKQFLPAEMWEEHARATEARKNTPKRPTYLSSYVSDLEEAKAANQIDSRSRSARANLHRVWYGMLAAMKTMLEASELTAYGQDDPPFGPWRAIPAPAWRKLRITNVGKGEASVGAHIVHDIYILPSDADDLLPTGTPGRPKKGIDVIRLEFQRRIAAKELAASLAAESRALADWYHQTYPRRDCPTAKTIENNIRLEYKEARAKLK